MYIQYSICTDQWYSTINIYFFYTLYCTVHALKEICCTICTLYCSGTGCGEVLPCTAGGEGQRQGGGAGQVRREGGQVPYHFLNTHFHHFVNIFLIL